MYCLEFWVIFCMTLWTFLLSSQHFEQSLFVKSFWKKNLSYLIGILKNSRCIWNWRWFEECSFGKVKYDIQIIERWLVEKRSSVNIKKKIKRKKITKRKNDVFKMTKEDIFPKNFWRHYFSRFALSINLSECRNSLSF